MEGEHAALHHGYSKARRHSEAYDSLLRRLPEIKEVLLRDGGFQEMCGLLQLTRSPRRAASALGLSCHLALEAATTAWHPMFRQVIYRADILSLYGPRPGINVKDPDPPPPLPEALASAPLPVDGDQDVAPAPASNDAQAAAQPIAALPAEQVGASFAYEDVKRRYAVQFFSLALASRAKESTEQPVYCMPVPAGAVRELRSLLSLVGPEQRAPEERPWWDDTGHGQPLATEGAQHKRT